MPAFPTARLLGLVAMLCALLGVYSAAADAAAFPLRTGVSSVYSNDPASFANVKSTGAQFVETPLWWPAVAPGPPPANPEDPADQRYHWEATDLWVTRAVAAGLTPVLQIGGAPPWADRCTTEIAAGTPCNPDPAALAAFAKAAVRRYSGHFEGLPRVRYWQGLNEPNLSLFFNPQFDEAGKPVSPTLYRSLINAFYFAVKSVDPSDLVLAAGLGPVAVPHYTIGPMAFTRQLLCMTGGGDPHPTPGSCGGGVHFDIFSIHPYTTGSPSRQGGPNDVELGDLPKLQKLLRAADRAGRIRGQFRHTPLWVSELSWDSKPPDPGGLPMRIETQWTSEALYRAWSAGVGAFFWFSIDDFPPEPQRSFRETIQSGLYFWAPTPAEEQPKQVLYAFRFPFVAFHRQAGLFFWGRTPTAGPGRVAIQVERGGHWHRAFVARADSHGMFSGLLPTQYGRDKHGAVRARYVSGASLPFPMRRVGDFRHPPFG